MFSSYIKKQMTCLSRIYASQNKLDSFFILKSIKRAINLVFWIKEVQGAHLIDIFMLVKNSSLNLNFSMHGFCIVGFYIFSLFRAETIAFFQRNEHFSLYNDNHRHQTIGGVAFCYGPCDCTVLCAREFVPIVKFITGFRYCCISINVSRAETSGEWEK